MERTISLKALADAWHSPFVAREEIERFSGGIITTKYIANLDSAGKGPKGRFRCGRKVVYPVVSLIEFMESRSSSLD
jgi:hypothetical protein